MEDILNKFMEPDVQESKQHTNTTPSTGSVYCRSIVSDKLISPWKLIHFGLIITSYDRSFRTSSVIWLHAGLGVAIALHIQAILFTVWLNVNWLT